MERIPLFFLWGFPFPTHLLGLKCPPPKERCLSMPETGEKERNYLFKSYTGLEYWCNVFIKILKSSRIPTDAQSFPLPLPSPGYRVSGKEVEIRDSGSRHHQLCGCRNLQLIQSHAAPSHCLPARDLSPLFFPAKSLLLPKPHGKKEHPKTTWSSPLLQNHILFSLCGRCTWV